MILACANAPLANRKWQDADEPWQFLAFCFEWKGFRHNGYGYVSHLPCMVDGSCNGIQHFSAMLRDPVGGQAVNLVPSGKPSDIYQTVADRVMERLYETAMSEHRPDACYADEREKNDWKLAYLWGGSKLIDRKVTKRPVMVLPYGGTFKSCRDYVDDAIREKWADGEVNPFNPEVEADAINYLAKQVWESISDVVVAARAAMDWLQKVGRLLSKQGVHPEWYTPDGFHVVQEYVDLKLCRIVTYFRGSAMKPTGKRLSRQEKLRASGGVWLAYSEETDKLSTRLNANGIAPNFVHSMDGCALRKTVNLAYHNGVDCFAVVHDSFGTHAADMEKLGACIRHAFVEMYEDHDVLRELYDHALNLIPEAARDELPEPPAMGELDLRTVLKSDFFFA